MHTAAADTCCHLDLGDRKAKDNLEFLTQIPKSSADKVAGIIELLTGRTIERTEERLRPKYAVRKKEAD